MRSVDGSWMDRIAGEVAAAFDRSTTLVCASGISPSGSIHMGNLREVFTTHLVTEALRHRGTEATHLHSWDDYDRLRKVPAGVPESYAQFIGVPLAEVPDPCGQHDSYATHYIEEFVGALTELGIAVTPVRQSERYPSGAYNAQIRRAMDERWAIFDILAEQQTAGRHELSVAERRRAYYPFKPYCAQCGKDDTTVVAYADPVAQYMCRHGHEGSVDLSDGLPIRGKLVWKVDWPMRWAYERVAFEPAGEDHHAPTGSFSVGKRIVADVYSGRAPHSAIYSFVSMAGVSGKMSGSRGSAAIPANVLGLIEPVITRWLYVRRLPAQSFSIDLGAEPIQRLYDEWDRFVAKASAPDADEVETRMLAASRATTSGHVDGTDWPVSFRLLGSVADITQGSIPQLTRIVRAHLDSASSTEDLPSDVDEFADLLRPRLDCAVRWAETVLPPESRTIVREEFNVAAWAELDELTRTGIGMLVDELADSWDLAALTKLVYAVPKRVNGLPPDAPPTPELKALQRRFFIALYRLFCSKDTGPRLPTLMLSIGLDRVRELLGGAAERAELS